MEALSIWDTLQDLHQSQKFDVCHRQNEFATEKIWLEIIKDYDVRIVYHPGNVNRVVDTLSRMPRVSLHSIKIVPWELFREVQKLSRKIVSRQDISEYLGAMAVQPTLLQSIINYSSPEEGY